MKLTPAEEFKKASDALLAAIGRFLKTRESFAPEWEAAEKAAAKCLRQDVYTKKEKDA